MSRIEDYLHRDPLHYLGEVSRRVIRRQKGELRSAGGRDLSYFPVQGYAGKGIDGDVGDIAFLDVGQLRLFVVGLNPNITSDQVDQLHAGSDELPFLHVTFADGPCRRREDAGVPEIDLGDNDGGLFCFDIGAVEIVLGHQRGQRPVLRFDHGLAAGKRSLGFFQVRLVASQRSL